MHVVQIRTIHTKHRRGHTAPPPNLEPPRKNKTADETEMNDVVFAHNLTNERTWTGILRCEQEVDGTCSDPSLLRFVGKSEEFSLRARAAQLMGYGLPFDRHDWIVDRCGKGTVR